VAQVSESSASLIRQGAGPIPPNLHWVIVLACSLLTGFFWYIWMFVQSVWVKKIDPASRATWLYVWSMIALLPMFPLMAAAVLVVPTAENPAVPALEILLGLLILGLASTALCVAAAFDIRASLLRYYNSAEPIGLKLSAPMTLFFQVLYLQYHFTRIAGWKESGVLA